MKELEIQLAQKSERIMADVDMGDETNFFYVHERFIYWGVNMDAIAEVSKVINIPKKDLIARSMLAFVEKEIRLSELDLADIGIDIM